MKLSRKVAVNAPPDALWALLSDFSRAAKCLPGVKELNKLEDNKYSGILEAGVGPVKINLKGLATLAMDEAQKRTTMTAEANDIRVGGGVKAVLSMQLISVSPTQSELQLDTEVTLMGRLGEMGQPIIKMKANSIVKEFAENLSKELKKK